MLLLQPVSLLIGFKWLIKKACYFWCLIPWKTFWCLFLFLNYYYELLMPLSHAGRESTLWLPIIITIIIINWLLPRLWTEKLDISSVLSQPSPGKNMPKMQLKILQKWNGKKNFLVLVYCMCPVHFSNTSGITFLCCSANRVKSTRCYE